MKSIQRSFIASAAIIGVLLASAGPIGSLGKPGLAEAAAPGCTDGDHGIFSGEPAGGGSFRFSTLDFLNPTTGRAAGNGFLIGTSDGGCNWQSIYQGTWQFSQMDFVSNTTGWALARSAASGPNALIRTADGGSTWEKLKPGTADLERIRFLDASRGFGYSRAFSYYTSDGGVSWSRIPTPPNTRGAEFSSRNTGWAIVVDPSKGYRLEQTLDGGKSWTTKLSAPSEEASGGVVRVSGQAVWAMLMGGAGMSQQSYSLYASSDSGSTWIRTIGQNTAGGGHAPGKGEAVTGMGPASPGGHPGELELIGATAILSGYSPAAGKVGIGRSPDGGRTWSSGGMLPGFGGAAISFASPAIGWITVDGDSGTAVYSTKDSGKSWTKTIGVAAKPALH